VLEGGPYVLTLTGGRGQYALVGKGDSGTEDVLIRFVDIVISPATGADILRSTSGEDG
jgi:hypothetical protein